MHVGWRIGGKPGRSAKRALPAEGAEEAWWQLGEVRGGSLPQLAATAHQAAAVGAPVALVVAASTGLDAELVRDRGACGDRVFGVDHRKVGDLGGVEVGEVASVRPRPVVGGGEASVDFENRLAAPAAEDLDLSSRRARGEQATSALGAGAVRAVAFFCFYRSLT